MLAIGLLFALLQSISYTCATFNTGIEGLLLNDKELKQKVNTAIYTLLKEKGFVAPVDVLMVVGVLSSVDYERWRCGAVDYLERVCKINLSKLSKIHAEIRAYAKRNNLKASWTFYNQWKSGKSKSKGNSATKARKLRFSKSGNENIENQYATHYIGQLKVAKAKERKEQKVEIKVDSQQQTTE